VPRRNDKARQRETARRTRIDEAAIERGNDLLRLGVAENAARREAALSPAFKAGRAAAVDSAA